MGLREKVLQEFGRGASYGEIAVVLGVSRNTVAGHVSRARGLGHLPPARPMVTPDVAIIAAMLASGSSVDAVTRKLRIATPTLKKIMAANDIRYVRPSSRRATARPSQPRATYVPIPTSVAVVVSAPVAETAVAFLEAGRAQCRFPMWDDTTPFSERMVCGGHAAGTYCSFHARLAYRGR